MAKLFKFKIKADAETILELTYGLSSSCQLWDLQLCDHKYPLSDQEWKDCKQRYDRTFAVYEQLRRQCEDLGIERPVQLNSVQETLAEQIDDDIPF